MKKQLTIVLLCGLCLYGLAGLQYGAGEPVFINKTNDTFYYLGQNYLGQLDDLAPTASYCILVGANLDTSYQKQINFTTGIKVTSYTYSFVYDQQPINTTGGLAEQINLVLYEFNIEKDQLNLVIVYPDDQNIISILLPWIYPTVLLVLFTSFVVLIIKKLY